jgi:hypothetical protein
MSAGGAMLGGAVFRGRAGGTGSSRWQVAHSGIRRQHVGLWP